MQNVNLYRPERRQAAGAQARGMLLGLAAALGLALLHGGWLGWQAYRGEVARARAEANAQAAEAALNELASRFQPPRLDAALPAQVTDQEAANRQLQAVLVLIDQLEQARGPGFLVLLSGLSEYHRPGLWLTRIRLRDGGRDLLLEGETAEQELLPLYLDGLGRSPAFAGRRFARLDLAREPGQALHFQLSSHVDEEAPR